MHPPAVKTMRSTLPANPDVGSYEVGQTIFVCAHRDASPPWKYQEFVCFKVNVEKTTEKAILLVDAISSTRKAKWVPKSLLSRGRMGQDGTMTHSYLIGNMLENEARFSVDAIYNNEGGAY